MKKALFAAAALTLASLSAANAVPVLSPVQSGTPGTAFANPTTTNFVGTYMENISNPGLIPGSRSPWENTPLDGSVYSSITGVVTFAFGSTRTALSFVWGSPDLYNDIFLVLNGVDVGTVNGGQISVCCGGNVTSSLVTISGVTFDSLRIESTLAAAEVANISAVPVPAAGILLVGALGGLAALRRRKAATA